MYPNFHNKKIMLMFRIILMLISVWAGMFFSLGMKEGYIITDITEELNNVYIPLLEKNWYGLKNPLWFKPYINEFTPKAIMVSVMICSFILLYMWAMEGDYIHKKEFGTSKYENPYKINKMLSHPAGKTPKSKIHKEEIYVRKWYRLFMKTKIIIEINTMNRRISENIYWSMDTRVTDRNNNLLLVAGSGAGKTFKVARNILRQMNGSYVVTDPKGELAKKEGRYLEERGYDVKVLNLLDIHSIKKSIRYNPFVYIKDDVDVIRLATNIMANTKKEIQVETNSFLMILLRFYWKLLCIMYVTFIKMCLTKEILGL